MQFLKILATYLSSDSQAGDGRVYGVVHRELFHAFAQQLNTDWALAVSTRGFETPAGRCSEGRSPSHQTAVVYCLPLRLASLQGGNMAATCCREGEKEEGEGEEGGGKSLHYNWDHNVAQRDDCSKIEITAGSDKLMIVSYHVVYSVSTLTHTHPHLRLGCATQQTPLQFLAAPLGREI